MRAGVFAVFLAVAAPACFVYHVNPPYARYVEPGTDALKQPDVSLSVEIQQTESAAFKAHAHSVLSKEAKKYNLAILSALKASIEKRRGVSLDPDSATKVMIASELPESSRNEAWVGCISLLTLLIFPVWNSYDYPIYVIVTQNGREIKRTQYRYSTTQFVGWLIPFVNLFVSSWKSNMYAGNTSRDEDVPRLLDSFLQRVTDDVVRTVAASSDTLL